jgi:hypothetical protein
VRRAAALLVLFATSGFAWVEAVEFPWNSFPEHLWERELVWLKNIGIRHVSLPPGNTTATDSARLARVVQIVRRLELEADLEGQVPDELQPLTRAHGGPLTEPVSGAVRIAATQPDTLARERHAISSRAPAIIWSDVEDTIGANGFKAGAVNFAGDETPATAPLRRAALLAGYWGAPFDEMRIAPGAGVQVAAGAKQPEGISVTEFLSPAGVAAVSIINNSKTAWTGEIRALERGGKPVSLPNVSVPARGAMMLPAHIPLVSGPLCKGCTGFAPADYLVYATAELTAMEYENGIIAMEFAAPAAGEVVLQLDHEPSGPLVAGGRPSSFDWDEHTMRVRLPIPAGKDTGSRVRIGLAMDAPDHTAFFENARVLLIGEANHLTAQFSSKEIGERSRLRLNPELPVTQTVALKKNSPDDPAASNEPVRSVYDISVPKSAVHGDYAELVLEADGIQMSHVRPQILRPATLRFPDAIQVRLARTSSYALYPSTIGVNARTGREITVSVRNNAAEIRNFKLTMSAEGLEFSPASQSVTIGASAAREVSFRVFANQASPGLHSGEVKLSGGAETSELFRVLVIPAAGEMAWTADRFYFLENAAMRASFLPGTWLEYLAKERGEERLPAPVTPFSPGSIAAERDALVFSGSRTVRMADLDRLAPRKEPPQRGQSRPR